MNRWLWWGAVLTTLLPLIAGCWDQRPVEGRALVEAVGVAPTGRRGVWQWTFVLPNPTESVSTLGTLPPSEEVYAVTVSAPTWTAALLATQQQTTRDLYFGQFRVLALSPRLPASAWARIIATVNRSGRLLKTFWIVDADPAGLVVRTPTRTEGAPLYGLFKLLSCHCQPYTWGQRAWQVWSRLMTPGVTPLVPVIRAVPQRGIQNPRMAVLGSRQVIQWSAAASAGWAYLTQHVVKGGLTVQAAGHRVGLNRVQGASHVTFTRAGSRIDVTDRLTYRGELEDAPLSLPLTLATKTAIAAQASRAIDQLGEQAIRSAQQQKVDPFGWHRDLEWTRNRSGSPWPTPISWAGWSVHLIVHFRITGEGVSH